MLPPTESHSQLLIPHRRWTLPAALHSLCCTRVLNNDHVVQLRQLFWDVCASALSERMFRTDLPRFEEPVCARACVCVRLPVFVSARAFTLDALRVSV